MPPERLSISESGALYGPPLLALNAILDTPNRIPREELKDILERLPDGTDAILQAVVWQIDSDPFLNEPPQQLISLMVSVAMGEEGKNKKVMGYLNCAWEFHSQYGTVEEFISKLKEIIEATKALYSLEELSKELYRTIISRGAGEK
ncbi:hypothetical protein TEQG_03087 [Trichophyton equinum CBS 127.97]|uniref:Uncharacterized protein n=1 Tax=Trichophyton equinum (strain ATCC MYA-4606 / CBS 127.97) TaxID=559882 RepID=F2PQ86_TRIEC|nr:hypothetical protein TEQG_03087 [Trichophyton equinum CBS 127.97]